MDKGGEIRDRTTLHPRGMADFFLRVAVLSENQFIVVVKKRTEGTEDRTFIEILVTSNPIPFFHLLGKNNQAIHPYNSGRGRKHLYKDCSIQSIIVLLESLGITKHSSSDSHIP